MCSQQQSGNQIDVGYQDAVRPIMYAQDCTFEYRSGSNLHTDGAICFTQRCTSLRSLVGDGFNYYDGPDGMPTQALEIDNIGVDNGIPEAKPFASNSARNKQGSSGHDSTIVCRINGYYANNYGQDIADTGSNSYTWMVGSVCGNPFGKVGGGAALGGFPALWTEGTAWLDNVTAGGRLATNGLYVQSGTCKTYRCGFSGTVAATGGEGVIANYDPFQL